MTFQNRTPKARVCPRIYREDRQTHSRKDCCRREIREDQTIFEGG